MDVKNVGAGTPPTQIDTPASSKKSFFDNLKISAIFASAFFLLWIIADGHAWEIKDFSSIIRLSLITWIALIIMSVQMLLGKKNIVLTFVSFINMGRMIYVAYLWTEGFTKDLDNILIFVHTVVFFVIVLFKTVPPLQKRSSFINWLWFLPALVYFAPRIYIFLELIKVVPPGDLGTNYAPAVLSMTLGYLFMGYWLCNDDGNSNKGKKKSRILRLLPTLIGLSIMIPALVFYGLKVSTNKNEDLMTMFKDYANKPWCKISASGTSMELDTDPKDLGSVALQSGEAKKEKDECMAFIKKVNKELGFDRSGSKIDFDNITDEQRGQLFTARYRLDYSYAKSKGLVVKYTKNR